MNFNILSDFKNEIINEINPLILLTNQHKQKFNIDKYCNGISSSSIADYKERIQQLDTTNLEKLINQALKIEEEMRNIYQDICITDFNSYLELYHMTIEFNQLIKLISKERYKLGEKIKEFAHLIFYSDEEKNNIDSNVIYSYLNKKEVILDFNSIKLNLLSTAKEKGIKLEPHIKKVKDNNLKIEFIKILAKKDIGRISANIEYYKIENEDALIEIAKMIAAQDGLSISTYIQRYHIKDEKALVEIAKIAAAQNGKGTSRNIKN